MDNLEKEFDFFKKKGNKKLPFFKREENNIVGKQEIDYLSKEFASGISIVCNYYIPIMMLIFVVHFLEVKQLDGNITINIFNIWKDFFPTFLIIGLFVESAKKIITMKDFFSPVKYVFLLCLSSPINVIIDNIFRNLIERV